MFDNKARQQLQTLQTQLEAWQHTVPLRAHSFHRRRQRLLEQIQTQLQRWLWISPEQAESYHWQLQQLANLATGIKALLQRVEILEGELERLTDRLEQFGRDAAEPALSRGLAERYRHWRQIVAQVGVRCERQGELLQDEAVVEQMATTLHLQQQALDGLQQAADILQILGTTADTDKLKAELPGLRRRLLEAEPTQEWLGKLQTLCRPLQDKITLPPPPELQDVAHMIADLRGWMRELEAFKPELEAGKSRELEKLKDEYMQLEKQQWEMHAEWRQRDATEFQGLLQAARALRERLTEAARQLRFQELQSLKDLKSDLEFAIGLQSGLEEQPGMDKQLELLEQKHRMVERYQAHRDWLAKLNEVGEYFKANVSNYRGELTNRLMQRVQLLQQELKALRNRPLSAEVREQLNELERQSESLAHVQGIAGILKGLRRCKAYEQELRRLSRQDEQEREALFASWQTLRQRYSRLQAEASQLGMPVEDFTQDFEALSEDAALQTLEQARLLAPRLDNRLQQAERQLLERCRTVLAERLDSMRRTGAALQPLGYSVTPLPSDPLDGVTDPYQAARLIADYLETQQTLFSQMEQALATREAESRRYLTELRRLHRETLAPDEREVLDRLLAELDEENQSQPEDKLERLQYLSAALQRGRAFLNSLFAEQHSIQTQLAACKERLRAFKEADLQRFCPEELSNRVKDLLYGIPEYPRQWSSVRQQLEQAEALLARLEVQARRLAAQELETTVTRLQRLPGRRDPRIKDLLAKLESEGHEELAPVALRKQLQALVPRSRGAW